MDQVISLRPNKQIINLFREIKIIEKHPESDRTAVVNRALKSASAANTIDWKAVANVMANVKINEEVAKSTPPDHMKFRVDAEQYHFVAEQIKDAFSLQRVKAPYLIGLVLTYYLLDLQKQKSRDVIKSVKRMVDFGIDGLVFKFEWDVSDYPQKKNLLQLCRIYLESCNPHINDSIREQVNHRIKGYSDLFNADRCFPPRRRTLGTCNILFVSKVLAGLFILVAEIEGYDLNGIVEALQQVTDNK